ncbi:peroxidase 4-like [Prosopis cineraria]|uniref:peroxidase 4-like n=1 Tax=Prosopis cineraria TaxID=364024 RepID=UPI002410A019|nr:peroxidase 4-like [Prosopis cineraria]
MALSSSSSSSSRFAIIVALSLFLVITGSTCSAQQLRQNFYYKTCPNLFPIVRSVVKSVVYQRPVLGAGLLRLFFHDCFVNGCDASILLDDTSTFTGEKTARPNNGSVRGFQVIDEIKSKVEAACPGIVSCADIVYIAARDSVVLLGGPNWEVKLGRRDSKTAFFSLAQSGVLPPGSSNLDNLISTFKAQGLSTRDMVALSGGHTIGQARCVTFIDRVYNEINIDPSFAKSKQQLCPRTGTPTNFIANLDVTTPNYFDNSYFKNLLYKKGLLHSDQVLFNGGSTDSLVRTYAQNKKAFDYDFVAGMIRMGDIKPLVYPNGEIRKNCRRVN